MKASRKRGRPSAQDTWGMAVIALGLRQRRADLSQPDAARAAIHYVIDEIARQNNRDPRQLARPGASYLDSKKVLQALRDLENKRPRAIKAVVRLFHNPMEGWTAVHGIREAIDGALATLAD